MTKPMTADQITIAIVSQVSSRKSVWLSGHMIARLRLLRASVAFLKGKERGLLKAALKRIAQLISRAGGHTHNSSSSGNFQNQIKRLGRSLFDGIQGASLNAEKTTVFHSFFSFLFRGFPHYETFYPPCPALHAALSRDPHKASADLMPLTPQMQDDLALTIAQASCARTPDDLAFGTHLRCVSHPRAIYHFDVPFGPHTNTRLTLSLRVLSQTTWELDLA